MLLHFLDTATTNNFILHCEMSSVKKVQAMAHKDFMVELVCQFCGVEKAGAPQSRTVAHVPVPTVTATDPVATKGRQKCKRCIQVD